MTDGASLAGEILTRRRRKCIDAGEHQEPPPGDPPALCPRCGL